MADSARALVEHLFRQEYGKLVSSITRVFGLEHIELAEDVVQETLISALHHWAIGEVPANPEGWLMQVARRKAINELKRNQLLKNIQAEGANELKEEASEQPTFLNEEIADSQLRMIFACCHPALKPESQIAIILKILCGFHAREIAHALLVPEATVLKRLYRAKKTLRESEVPFSVPDTASIEGRLETVCLALYLLFNEGYSASSQEVSIRKDLCLEAMRLTKLLTELYPDRKTLQALMALMCLHSARFDARISDSLAVVLFEDQERSLWNAELIAQGLGFLKRAMGGQALSAYHVEAAIAAEHSLAKNFATTDWKSIYNHYTLLERIKPTPMVRLSKTIVQSKVEGTDAALQTLNGFDSDEQLASNPLFWITKGVFQMELGHFADAAHFLNLGLDMNPPAHIEQHALASILRCEKELPETKHEEH